MDNSIDREELVELLTLCIKEQKFYGSIPQKRAIVFSDMVDTIVLEEPMYVKSILERMGRALIDASEHIK